jgi:ABC-type glycerol-3-phosphate transport system substrate-binding protein
MKKIVVIAAAIMLLTSCGTPESEEAIAAPITTAAVTFEMSKEGATTATTTLTSTITSVTTASDYEEQPAKPFFDAENSSVEEPVYEKIPLEAEGLPEHYQWYLIANKEIHIFGAASGDGGIDRVSVYNANGEYLRSETFPDRTDLNNYYDKYEVDYATQKTIKNALYTAQGNNFLPITTEVAPVSEGIMYSVAERAVYVDTGERKTRKLLTVVNNRTGGGMYTYDDIYPTIRMFNLSQDEYAAVYLCEEDDNYPKDLSPDVYLSPLGGVDKPDLLDLTQFYSDEHYDWLPDYYTDYVKPFFILQTAYAYAEYAGDEPGWTVDDILRIAKENPGVQVIEGDDRHGLSTMFVEDTLLNAIDLDTYKKDGVYDFDNKEFRDILTHVKTYYDHELTGIQYNYDPIMTEKIRTKESLSNFDQYNGSAFYNHTTNFARVAYQRNEYFNGEDITVKGFPTVDGKSGQFHNSWFSYSYGVNKNAPNLGGAKAFIKFILSDEYGETAGALETDRGGFSINRKANEQIAEAVIGEIGKTSDGIKYAVTREDVDDLLRALEYSGIGEESGMYYVGMGEFIKTETPKFYHDEQTLDETIANINKAVNAVNE